MLLVEAVLKELLNNPVIMQTRNTNFDCRQFVN